MLKITKKLSIAAALSIFAFIVLTAVLFTGEQRNNTVYAAGTEVVVNDYTKLQNAIANAASGDTVKVNGNIYYPGDGSPTITVSKNLTLDLNNSRIQGGVDTPMFNIGTGATLTVTDSSTNKGGVIYASQNYPMIVLTKNSSSSLNVNSGKIKQMGHGTAIDHGSGGNVNISDNAIIESGSHLHHAIVSDRGNINISGGEISGYFGAISQLNGSTFDNVTTITGGKLSMTGESFTDVKTAINNERTLSGNSILNISGGEITAVNKNSSAIRNTVNSTATISGGKITAPDIAIDNQAAADKQLSISNFPIISGKIKTHKSINGNGYNGGAIDISLYPNTETANWVLVSGSTDLTRFRLISDYFKLVADEKGNLILFPLTPLPNMSVIASAAYSGVKQTPTVTIPGLTLDTDYTLSWDDPSLVNAKTYTVTATGTGNYGGTKTQTFTITKINLTVTAKNHTIKKGDDPSNNGVTYSGFVNGETESVLKGALTFAYNYNSSTSEEGKYTITPGGFTSDNYAITYVNGELTVNSVGGGDIGGGDIGGGDIGGGDVGGEPISAGAVVGIVIGILLGLFIILIVLYVLWKKSILKGNIFNKLIRWLDPAAVKVCRLFCKKDRLFTLKGTYDEQKQTNVVVQQDEEKN